MRKDKFIRECVYDLIRDCENELEDIFGMEFLIRKNRMFVVKISYL